MVAFSDVVETVMPQSAARRHFSEVRDSEDEGDDLEDEDGFIEGQDIGAQTQRFIFGIDNLARGKNIGSETQAILQQIDQACANAEEDTILEGHESSQELGLPVLNMRRDERSQELGVQWDDSAEQGSALPNHDHSADGSASISIDQQVREETQPPLLLPNMQESSLPASVADQLDKAADYPPTPPQHPSSSGQPLAFEPTLVDCEPIQVARSPPPEGTETQETDRSHSSKAELQLQSESMSYSHHPIHSLPPPSSIVGNANNTPSGPTAPLTPSKPATAPPHWSAPLSQATTVDFTQRTPKVTPKKASRIPSANTTPHRIPNSQPFISPQRPDTLVIPSSYPSPSKTSYKDWSSPVLGRSELGSLEDFSIPPLPPGYDEDSEL
jgi:hypothetical protein